MITLMIFTLIAGGIFAWMLGDTQHQRARLVALFTVLLSCIEFLVFITVTELENHGLTLIQHRAWLPSLNIYFILGVDLLSVILISLTMILALVCVLVSWREITEKPGFYYFNLLATIAGIIGVFTAIDMLLFFIFWEVMLLPMTAIIAIWGHENRRYAAIKFFIFTQVSSLLMLASIAFMAYSMSQEIGSLNFNYIDWLAADKKTLPTLYIMLGFFVAFAVKLPSIPVHSWLPDAHTQAPTAGSVLLAGVLLKTGAYGLIRFVVQLFPNASEQFAFIGIVLGVISILYGAKLAFAQSDIKRLIAYSSISHMGFVMLALFSFQYIAYQGAIFTLIAHGLSSAALFTVAGMMYRRLHTRDISAFGGLFDSAPRLGGFMLAFCAAAFGLPGLANFVGEFMVLVGVFQITPIVSAIAALGMVGSAIYGMRLFQDSFQGQSSAVIADISARELSILSLLLLLLIFFGLFPQVLLQWFSSDGNAMVYIFYAVEGIC